MNMKFADFYTNRIWPIHRKFVKLDKRCNNCIISEKYAPILNSGVNSGICTYCYKYLNQYPDAFFTDIPKSTIKPQSTELWNALIEFADYGGALFLLSGGKDSLYTLLRYRKEFPDMPLLCITVNTGFIRQEVFDRCSRICNQLEVDYQIVNHLIPEFYDRYQKTFRQLKTKTGNNCVDFDEGSLIFQTAEKIAKQNHIPLVISGLSIEQCEDVANTDSFFVKGKNNVDFLYPMTYWQGLTDDDIYTDLKKQKITDNLSPVVSNNQLIPAMSAIDILNHGYCGFEFEMSKRIRSRRTKRTPWLHRFEMLEYMTKKGLMNKTINETLSKLQLTRADVLTNPA